MVMYHPDRPKKGLFMKNRVFFIASMVFVSVLAACQIQGSSVDPSILFKDNFSSPKSAWDQYSDSSGVAEYKDGSYRLFVNVPDSDYWSTPKGLSFEDTQIEVDVQVAGGSENNVFGIICRYQDSGNFYQLLISSDGYFDISKVSNNQRIPLTGEYLSPSSNIPDNASTLTIRADCVGDQLILYVNGTQITKASDSDFNHGNVGLTAGTFETPGTDILFDNFIVRKP